MWREAPLETPKASQGEVTEGGGAFGPLSVGGGGGFGGPPPRKFWKLSALGAILRVPEQIWGTSEIFSRVIFVRIIFIIQFTVYMGEGTVKFECL